MLIQVDVDSTLYDANKLFYQLAKEEFGIEWPRKYYSWFGPEDIGTDLATLKSVFRKAHSREYVMQQKPYPKAAEVLGRLVETFDSAEIAYVSDRNEQQTGALRDWLDEHGFLFSEDQFVAATKDKRHWMRERKPEVVIDDRVRTMLMARQELNAYVISLEHPHNMNLKNEVEHIYIVDNWEEIEKVLHDIVIPKIQEKDVSFSRQRHYAGV